MAELVDVQGTHVAWRESSPHGGTSDTVILLHGLGGSRISWEPQLQSLGDQVRVVAWDMPGYGTSPACIGPMTFTALSAAVVGLIDEVGGDAVHLVGISFGAMIAQYVAASAGPHIASLTLLATSPKFGLDGTEPDAWRAQRLAPLDAGQSPGDFADQVLAGLAGPQITAEALAGQRAAMARISADALRAAIECLLTHDTRALLASIVAPTLCLVGALDDETPTSYSQAIVDLVPGAELRVVAGAGHLLNVEAPDVVNAAILDQIRRGSRT